MGKNVLATDKHMIFFGEANMQNTLLMNFKGAQTQKKSKGLHYVNMLTLILVAAIFSTATIAGTGGTEFQEVYGVFIGWIEGVGGKIIALLAFGVAMFNVVKQNFIMAAGAFASAVVMANIANIINAIMQAGVPVL